MLPAQVSDYPLRIGATQLERPENHRDGGGLFADRVEGRRVPPVGPIGCCNRGKTSADRDPTLPPSLPHFLILSSIYLSPYHPTQKMEDLESYQTPLARSDPRSSTEKIDVGES